MSSIDFIAKLSSSCFYNHLIQDTICQMQPSKPLYSGTKPLTAYPRQKHFDPDFVTTIISQRNNADLVEIVLDTGCTFAITPSKKDFVEYHPIPGGSNSYIQKARLE
jgi:hypothetical protein